MKISSTLSDSTILAEFGRRAQQQRVSQNLTQAQLAAAAGVSARTIERLESGRSIQLDNLTRILRGLRISENLDRLIPENSVRPIQQLGGKSSQRQRASTKRPGHPVKGGWVWGDKQ